MTVTAGAGTFDVALAGTSARMRLLHDEAAKLSNSIALRNGADILCQILIPGILNPYKGSYRPDLEGILDIDDEVPGQSLLRSGG